MKISNKMLVAGALFALIGIFSITGPMTAGAQTHHRTPRTKPTPKPMATPPSTTAGDAEIISQASDDQQPETVRYLGPPAQKPTESGAEQDPNAKRIKELSGRIKKLESNKTNEYDERQKRMLMNLDILTRAEQRSESLRKELFDMMEKETSINTKLDQLDMDARPEAIDRSVAITGSMKPEELRDMKQKAIDAERANLQAMLNQIEAAKTNITASLAKSDELVEKLRTTLERDIDTSLKAGDTQDPDQ